MKFAIVILYFVALTYQSNINNLQGSYQVIDSICSQSPFSGCPYTKTAENSDWMCLNQNPQYFSKFTCDRESNNFFLFKDDGYIYNSDIKMKIVFDPNLNYWTSKDSDIQEIIYQCGSINAKNNTTQIIKDLENLCNNSVKNSSTTTNKRIIATQNSTQPCATILERVSEAEPLYSESLDKYGKIHQCFCGKISFSQEIDQVICSSQQMETQCSKDVRDTEFGQLICECGKISFDSEGKFKCETGTIQVKYFADFKKYMQKLTIVNSEYDEEGNQIESIDINMEAEIVVSAEVNEEKFVVRLGFNTIDMKKVQVTQNQKTSNGFLFPTKKDPASSSSPIVNEPQQLKFQILYEFQIDRTSAEDISESIIKQNLKRSLETSATEENKEEEQTYDLFDTIAIKGIKQELENYQTKLALAADGFISKSIFKNLNNIKTPYLQSKERRGQQKLSQEQKSVPLVYSDVIQVSNGLVNLKTEEIEKEETVVLIRSFSENDFVQLDFDLGGDLPEINHKDVLVFDKDTGAQIQVSETHHFRYNDRESDTQAKINIQNKKNENGKSQYFRKRQNKDSDQKISTPDEIMTTNVETTINWNSLYLETVQNKSEIDSFKQAFEKSQTSQKLNKNYGAVQIDEQFELIEDSNFDESRVDSVDQIIQNYQISLEKGSKNSKKIINEEYIKNVQTNAKAWRQNFIQRMNATIRSIAQKAKKIGDDIREISELINQQYHFDDYFKIRNTKFFGQLCEIGIGFTQNNNITKVAVVVKVNNLLQFTIQETQFVSCSQIDETLFKAEIKQNLFSLKYPIWGFIHTFVQFNFNFDLMATLKSYYNQQSHTCISNLQYKVEPHLDVVGGVRAFALANIGIYGLGQFFTGNLKLNVETWGPIHNHGELSMDYSLYPFQYQTGFYKQLSNCQFNYMTLFTFKKSCTLGDQVVTPLYYNDYQQLSIENRVLNFLDLAWGSLPNPNEQN